MSEVTSRDVLIKLLDSSLDAFCAFDPNGHFIHVNGACVRIWGYEPKELIGRRYIDLVLPEDRPQTVEAAEGVREGRFTPNFRNRFLRKDGSVAHIMWSARWAEEDQVLYAVARDVTASHRAKEALRHSEDLLRMAGQMAKFGGWLVELRTGRMTWSEEVYAIHELPLGTLTTMTQEMRFYPPEWRGVVRQAFRSCALYGTPFDLETELITARGRRTWVRTTGQPKRDTLGVITHVLGAFQDISAQKETEAEARKLENRLFTVLESITDSFLTLDREWRFTYINRQAERLLQRPREELLGRVLWEVFPEAVDSVFEQRYRHAISAQAAVHFEEFQTRLNRWLNVSAYPIEEGLAIHLQDVTDRKKMEAQLAQAAKLESIGRLAGGLAHDFNNLLCVILGYTEVALSTLPQDDAIQADLQQVREAGERGADLTRQLLAFARKQIIQPKVIDLNTHIISAQKLLRRLIGEHIELVHVLAEEGTQVCMDPGQFEQVLINLAVNARDAMPEGGRIVLETCVVDLDAEYGRLHAPATPGRYVLFSVSDNGEGIDHAVLGHVFEPFFTTKETGKGTGLGLATCHGIVHQAGGHIWVYSEPGKGSTFKVYLPAAGVPAPAPGHSEPENLRTSGTERVLLVEDEGLVRDMVHQALEAEGYAVWAAESPTQALEMAEAQSYQFDLLLTDVVMPHMSGEALAQRLAPLNPAMKVLFVSGYTEHSIVQHGVLREGIDFLPKPFTPASLARKVRSVLDGRP